MYKSTALIAHKENDLFIDLNVTTAFILSVQKKDGEIPWSTGGKTDPWDHVESAMGLTIGGCLNEAKKAYRWSANNQLKDGSWWSEYKEGAPIADAFKDTNMTSYIAVGLYHYYLSTKDDKFLREMWPVVVKAIDYTLDLQGEGGEIFWAKRKDGSVDERGLLTGSSSIYLSLRCALKIASILGEQKPLWEIGRMRLGDAIRHKPHLFDQSKSRFSMDWYYPVLCGTIRGKEAKMRIEKYWDTFIIDGWGVRCVLDEPWLTMAETSELVIALAAIEDYETSEMVFNWILDKKYEDGAFYTGVTFPDRIIYTTEKTSWTSAAVLLAADILYDLTPASQLFKHSYWKPLSVPS